MNFFLAKCKFVQAYLKKIFNKEDKTKRLSLQIISTQAKLCVRESYVILPKLLLNRFFFFDIIKVTFRISENIMCKKREI